MYSENYPFDERIWTVSMQNYLCTMHGYGFPLERMPEKYAYIIEQGRCDTFEQEYQEYLASQE